MFVGLSFIVCMSFCSTGCSNRNADLQPEASAVVLKFKNPDYKNYILANYFEGKDLVLVNRDSTPFDGMATLVIRESIGSLMKQVMEEIAK